MIYDFNLAYPYIFICLVLILLITALYRWFWWQPTRYASALTSYLLQSNLATSRYYAQYILFGLRFFILILFCLLVARPQSVDPKSKAKVDGIDIVLVLDVSQSMHLIDNLDQPVSRMEVAKKEAINFIKQRVNDAIGLVLFGNYAISRCPLTLDKAILQELVTKIEIGDIDPYGTMLGIGIMTGINRLKASQAKSKVMIVLTDGQPSPGDIDPLKVIEIAQKLDIKIYTVGIGSHDGGYFNHPFYGYIRQGEEFNHKLLEQIASQTQGQFFAAKNSQQLRQIYTQIDQLEKTSNESTVFTKKYEYFGLFIKLILFFCLLELFLTYFVWFGI
jgi:Ca-activated chloride channel family protein